jgi:glycerophosphoryl diester phosphodiesterase
MDWLTRWPIAHRGLHDQARGVIENSAGAVARALEHGYAIEVDLQPAGDGVPMVFHDATLDRLTEHTGRLADKTAAQLRKIPIRQTSDRMQSLAELLEQVAGKTTLILEVKSQWGATGPLERAISEVLKPYHGPVAVMSFDPLSVRALAEAAPQVPRGLVAERFRDTVHWRHLTTWQRFRRRHLLTVSKARAQFIAYDIRGLPSAAPLIARHIGKMPLLTWTVRPGLEAKARRWADQMIFEGFEPAITPSS